MFCKKELKTQPKPVFAIAAVTATTTTTTITTTCNMLATITNCCHFVQQYIVLLNEWIQLWKVCVSLTMLYMYEWMCTCDCINVCCQQSMNKCTFNVAVTHLKFINCFFMQKTRYYNIFIFSFLFLFFFCRCCGNKKYAEKLNSV